MASTTETNFAAYLSSKQARPFQVKEAPMPIARPDEVIIRVKAIAINPCDAAIQRRGILLKHYPAIIGEDISGVIVSLGPDANTERTKAGYDNTPLKVGDRVIAGADGTDLSGLDGPTSSRSGGFQNFVAVAALRVALLPESVGWGDGAVLPLAMATAASCLFSEDEMGLEPPKIGIAEKKVKGVVLIWGAASSVGACAVQLLKAAGYEVAATASEANLEMCRGMGAEWVFDYKKDGVEKDIIKTLEGKSFEGVYDAIMYPETIFACARIALALGGKKIVGTVYPPPMPLPDGRPEGVQYAFSSGTFRTPNSYTVAVWGNWVTPALANGLLKCLPEKLVVGKGLESIQAAIDRYEEGISARKVVVELD